MSSKQNKQLDFVPSEQEKRWILHDAIYYEIVFAFGVAPHDRADYCAWEQVNFSRMGHARALYDFFETSIEQRKKRRQNNADYDDVVSEDFDFPAQQISRPQGDRVRLNKDLFHITYKRTRHRDNPEQKPWPDTIISCLHKPCVEFINHLLVCRNKFGDSNDFKKWEQLRDLLLSRHELQIGQEFRLVGRKIGVAPNYTFVLGRSLQNDCGELTKPLFKAGS